MRMRNRAPWAWSTAGNSNNPILYCASDRWCMENPVLFHLLSATITTWSFSDSFHSCPKQVKLTVEE